MDEQKYCQNCGAAISPGAAFCAKCGKTFTSASTSPTPAPPRSTLVVRSTSPTPAPPPPTPQGPSDYQRPSPLPKPQRRFEKRYVLYGIAVLFFLAVAAAVVSSPQQPNTNLGTPTPTLQAPTATPSGASASSFDPILTKMEPVLKAEYTSPNANITITESPKNAGQSVDMLHFDVYYPANGTTIGATIDNRGASEASASVTSLSASDISGGGVQGTPTNFGLQAATVALGHAPSLVQDYYVKGAGMHEGTNSEYIQYDSLLIQVTYTAGEGG